MMMKWTNHVRQRKVLIQKIREANRSGITTVMQLSSNATSVVFEHHDHNTAHNSFAPHYISGAQKQQQVGGICSSQTRQSTTWSLVGRRKKRRHQWQRRHRRPCSRRQRRAGVQTCAKWGDRATERCRERSATWHGSGCVWSRTRGESRRK